MSFVVYTNFLLLFLNTGRAAVYLSTVLSFCPLFLCEKAWNDCGWAHLQTKHGNIFWNCVQGRKENHTNSSLNLREHHVISFMLCDFWVDPTEEKDGMLFCKTLVTFLRLCVRDVARHCESWKLVRPRPPAPARACVRVSVCEGEREKKFLLYIFVCFRTRMKN